MVFQFPESSPSVNGIKNIGSRHDIMHYAEKEWRGGTDRAEMIKKVKRKNRDLSKMRKNVCLSVCLKKIHKEVSEFHFFFCSSVLFSLFVCLFWVHVSLVCFPKRKIICIYILVMLIYLTP